MVSFVIAFQKGIDRGSNVGLSQVQEVSSSVDSRHQIEIAWSS